MSNRDLAKAVKYVFRPIYVSQNVAMPVLVLTNPNYHNLAPPIHGIRCDPDPSDPKNMAAAVDCDALKTPLCTYPDGTTKKPSQISFNTSHKR